MISCINYKNSESMISYIRNAYNIFFDNEFESIDTQEIIDQFCSEKDIDNQFVKKIMHEIDKDHSNTITAAEFIQNVVQLLGTGITDVEVIQELKYPSSSVYPLPINQSGTFYEYDFDDDQRQVGRNGERRGQHEHQE